MGWWDIPGVWENEAPKFGIQHAKEWWTHNCQFKNTFLKLCNPACLAGWHINQPFLVDQPCPPRYIQKKWWCWVCPVESTLTATATLVPATNMHVKVWNTSCLQHVDEIYTGRLCDDPHHCKPLLSVHHIARQRVRSYTHLKDTQFHSNAFSKCRDFGHSML